MKQVEVAVGFAADEGGAGVVYARFASSGTLLRVPFTVQRLPALREREVGYAALIALSPALRRRGVMRVQFGIADESLACDLRAHCDVPPRLSLPYIRLRCALNQFAAYGIANGSPEARELSARAKAELTMHAAA